MKFLADHMLGSLARWLRFFGFDTAYPDVLPDKDLAKVKGLTVLYVDSTNLEEQLTQVIKKFNLKIKDSFSRCSVCNSILIQVDKAAMEGKVPEKVYQWQDKFWKCPKCRKYYWQGTHFQGIKRKLEELERKSATA